MDLKGKSSAFTYNRRPKYAIAEPGWKAEHSQSKINGYAIPTMTSPNNNILSTKNSLSKSFGTGLLSLTRQKSNFLDRNLVE